jgi:hypothetical protein
MTDDLRTRPNAVFPDGELSCYSVWTYAGFLFYTETKAGPPLAGTNQRGVPSGSALKIQPAPPGMPFAIWVHIDLINYIHGRFRGIVFGHPGTSAPPGWDSPTSRILFRNGQKGAPGAAERLVWARISNTPKAQSSVLRNVNLRSHWWGGARKRNTNTSRRFPLKPTARTPWHWWGGGCT